MSGKYLKNCLVCSCEFEANHFNEKKCDECKTKLFCKICGAETDKNYDRSGTIHCEKCRIEKTRIKFTEENKYEWIECQICGFRGEDIAGHLIHRHNIRPENYDFGVKSQKLCDKIKGENNPGYQHGGKLSPWSKKSEYHSEEFVVQCQKEAVQKGIMNGNSAGTTKIDFYLNQGMSLEDATKALSNRQTTFSLEKCIEKYGTLIGVSVWQERQNKWQDNINSKPDEERQRINSLKVGRGAAVSKPEKELFAEISKEISGLKSQFQIKTSKNTWFMYDIQYGCNIIEFNGDFWHMNPALYAEDFYNKRIKCTASEIRLKDKEKAQCAIDSGYKILVVWEKDYKNNKDETIKKCIEFLKQQPENSLTQFM